MMTPDRSFADYLKDVEEADVSGDSIKLDISGASDDLRILTASSTSPSPRKRDESSQQQSGFQTPYHKRQDQSFDSIGDHGFLSPFSPMLKRREQRNELSSKVSLQPCRKVSVIVRVCEEKERGNKQQCVFPRQMMDAAKKQADSDQQQNERDLVVVKPSAFGKYIPSEVTMETARLVAQVAHISSEDWARLYEFNHVLWSYVPSTSKTAAVNSSDLDDSSPNTIQSTTSEMDPHHNTSTMPFLAKAVTQDAIHHQKSTCVISIGHKASVLGAEGLVVQVLHELRASQTTRMCTISMLEADDDEELLDMLVPPKMPASNLTLRHTDTKGARLVGLVEQPIDNMPTLLQALSGRKRRKRRRKQQQRSGQPPGVSFFLTTIRIWDDTVQYELSKAPSAVLTFVELALPPAVLEKHQLPGTVVNTQSVLSRKSVVTLGNLLRGMLIQEHAVNASMSFAQSSVIKGQTSTLPGMEPSLAVSYREALLTKLLQRPLEEYNSKVVIIGSISPYADDYDSTLGVLNFCRRLLVKPGKMASSPFKAQRNPDGSYVHTPLVLPTPGKDGESSPALNELVNSDDLLEQILCDPRQRLAKIFKSPKPKAIPASPSSGIPRRTPTRLGNYNLRPYGASNYMDDFKQFDVKAYIKQPSSAQRPKKRPGQESPKTIPAASSFDVSEPIAEWEPPEEMQEQVPESPLQQPEPEVDFNLPPSKMRPQTTSPFINPQIDDDDDPQDSNSNIKTVLFQTTEHVSSSTHTNSSTHLSRTTVRWGDEDKQLFSNPPEADQTDHGLFAPAPSPQDPPHSARPAEQKRPEYSGRAEHSRGMDYFESEALAPPTFPTVAESPLKKYIDTTPALPQASASEDMSEQQSLSLGTPNNSVGHMYSIESDTAADIVPVDSDDDDSELLEQERSLDVSKWSAWNEHDDDGDESKDGSESNTELELGSRVGLDSTSPTPLRSNTTRIDYNEVVESQPSYHSERKLSTSTSVSDTDKLFFRELETVEFAVNHIRTIDSNLWQQIAMALQRLKESKVSQQFYIEQILGERDEAKTSFDLARDDLRAAQTMYDSQTKEREHEIIDLRNHLQESINERGEVEKVAEEVAGAQVVLEQQLDMLRGQLEQSQNKTASQESKLADLLQEKDEMKRTLDEDAASAQTTYEQHLNALKDQLEQSQNEITSQESKLEDVLQEKDEMKRALEEGAATVQATLKEQLDMLQNQLEQSQNQTASQESKMADLLRGQDEMKRALDEDAASAQATFEQHFKALQAQLERAKNKVASQESKLADALQDKDALKNALDEDAATAQASYEQHLNALKDQLDQSQKKVASHESKLAGIFQEQKTLKKALTEKETSLYQMKMQLEQGKNSSNDLKAQIQQLKEGRDKQQSESHQHQQTIQELKIELRVSESKTKNLEAKAEQAMLTTSEKSEIVDALRNDIARLEHLRDDLESGKIRLEEGRKHDQQRLDQLAKDVLELDNAKRKLEEENYQFKLRDDKSQISIHHLTRKIEEFGTEISNLQAYKRNADDEKAASKLLYQNGQNQIKQLNETIEKLRAASTELQTTKSMSEREKSELKRLQETSQGTIHLLNQQIEQLQFDKLELENWSRQLEEEKADFKNLNETSLSKMQAMHRVIEQFKIDITDLEESRKEAEEEAARYRMLHEESQNMFQQISQESSSLEANKESLLGRNQELVALGRTSELTIQALQHEIESLKALITNMEDERNTAYETRAAENEELDAELYSLKVRAETLHQDNKHLEETIRRNKVLIGNLENKLKEENGERQKLEAERMSLSATRLQDVTTIESLQDELRRSAGKDSDLENLLKELSQLRQDNIALEASLTGRKTEYYRDLDIREKELSQLRMELESTRTEASSLRERERISAEKLEKSSSQLRGRLAEFEKQISQVRRQKTDIQVQLDSVIMKFNHASSSLSAKDEEVKSYKNEINRLVAELKSAKERVRVESNSSEDKVRDLEYKIATLESVVAEAERNNVEMRDKIFSQNRMLSSSSVEVEQFKSEVITKTTTIESLHRELASIRADNRRSEDKISKMKLALESFQTETKRRIMDRERHSAVDVQQALRKNRELTDRLSKLERAIARIRRERDMCIESLQLGKERLSQLATKSATLGNVDFIFGQIPEIVSPRNDPHRDSVGGNWIEDEDNDYAYEGSDDGGRDLYATTTTTYKRRNHHDTLDEKSELYVTRVATDYETTLGEDHDMALKLRAEEIAACLAMSAKHSIQESHEEATHLRSQVYRLEEEKEMEVASLKARIKSLETELGGFHGGQQTGQPQRQQQQQQHAMPQSRLYAATSSSSRGGRSWRR